jgi:hypothetical protein
MMQLITWHEFTNCAKLWSNDSWNDKYVDAPNLLGKKNGMLIAQLFQSNIFCSAIYNMNWMDQ